MEKIFILFNTRELATIVWVFVFCIWAISKTEIRKSLGAVFIAGIKLWKILFIMTMYVLCSVLLLHCVFLWEPNFMSLKITVFWFVGWALIMFIDSSKIGKEAGYLKKKTFELISLTTLISFITNFYSFNILIELALVPLITIVAVLSTFTSIKKEYSQVNSIMNGTLITFGLAILLINLGKAVANFNEMATFSTLQEFLLPIALSLIFLPFLLVLSLYTKYEIKKIREKPERFSHFSE